MKWLPISSLIWTFFLASAGFIPDHALYISVISVEHEEGSSEATIQFKIFKDDLNDAIYNESARRYQIDQLDNTDYQTDIRTYLDNHFMLAVNGVQTTIVPESFAIQGDAAFISCTATVPIKWNKTGLEATLLYELFPTQQNMIHYRDGKIKQFARLSSGDCRVVFE